MSAHTLKSIAIVAMVIDHVAWAFVPLESLQGQIMHIVGRLTAPIMCFFIAEGARHTRSIEKYATRLGVFALISHAPFYYFESGHSPFTSQGVHLIPTSVIYTLFLGLLALVVWRSPKLGERVKLPIVWAICIAATPGDWGVFGVLWILFFGIHQGDFRKQALWFSFVAFGFSVVPNLIAIARRTDPWYRGMFQLGVFLALPLLRLYNGERGGGRGSKWFFYVFYPLHLIVIGILKYGF